MTLYHYAPFTLEVEREISDEAPLSSAHSEDDADVVAELSTTWGAADEVVPTETIERV